MKDKIPVMFELFRDVLCNAQLSNQKRAVEMLKESKSRRESSVISSGHSYAAVRLGAKQSLMGYYKERTGGLTYARSLDRLLNEAENNWNEFQKKLESIRDLLLKNEKDSLIINLTGDDPSLTASKDAVSNFVQQLSKLSSTTSPKELSCAGGDNFPFIPGWNNSMLLPPENEGFIIPSQVCWNELLM